MKIRRVMLMLEVKTDVPIAKLRDMERYRLTIGNEDALGELWAEEQEVLQVQANVIRDEKKRKGKR